jgi:hypothetical protein
VSAPVLLSQRLVALQQLQAAQNALRINPQSSEGLTGLAFAYGEGVKRGRRSAREGKRSLWHRTAPSLGRRWGTRITALALMNLLSKRENYGCLRADPEYQMIMAGVRQRWEAYKKEFDIAP